MEGFVWKMTRIKGLKEQISGDIYDRDLWWRGKGVGVLLYNRFFSNV